MVDEKTNVMEFLNLDTNVEEEFSASSAVDVLKEKTSPGVEYQVVAHCVNELRMGWYKDGNFTFAKEGKIADEHLQQLRVFNAEEEVLLKKTGHNYWVRRIHDSGNGKVKAVDSTSTIFGNRIVESKLVENFVTLYEPGRKVKLVIPVRDMSDKYCLTTRSYVVYDEETGQAGYGYYRYVEIKAEGR